MTTAPDHITRTAPKRIYLDLDGESPSIKPEDTFRDIEMRMGFTWSENCAMGHGIPYVRADLVPTPAPSGAAPADIRAALEMAVRQNSHDMLMTGEEIRQCTSALAALASREAPKDWNGAEQSALNDWFLALPEGRRKALLEGDRWMLAGAAFLAGRAAQPASPSPLTETPQELERALGQAIDERDERDEVIDALCDAVLGKHRAEWSSLYGFCDAVSEVEEHMAALASPQVAPAPAMIVVMDEGAREPRIMSWNEMAVGRHFLYTSPAPVAPTPTVLETCNCLWRGEVLVQQCELHQAWQDTLHERAEEVRGLRQGLATPVQVAPTPVEGTVLEELVKWSAEAVKLLCSEDHEVRDRLRAVLAMVATAAPVAPQDDARDAAQPEYFDAYLCRAWGETDLPAVELVLDEAGIRAFMVREWLGSEDKTANDGTPLLPEAMEEIAQHNWQDDPVWSIDFEIGGVSVERVTGFAPAAKPTEEQP